jgi:hypothetical protein
VPTETIIGNYYGATAFFLVRYAGSNAYYYGTLTKNGLGQILGPGKNSGGVAHTYIATSSVLWQANQAGCQDLGIAGEATIAGTTINTTTTRTFGAISDNDGFSSVNPDLTVTVSFGDGSHATCAGSACFTGSALPEHVRLINCTAGALPALPGSAVFLGVHPDTGCQVQATHVYKTASGVNGYPVTLSVKDQDQNTQPAPAVDTIHVAGG